MKTCTYSILVLLTITLLGCSKVNDPEPVNQEEVITTMLVTLKPISGKEITLTSRDLDGDGPEPPFIKVSGPLIANTVYDGTIVLLNETQNPAENVTEEVKEEAGEHQFFYTLNGLDTVRTAYADQESDYPPNDGDKPVGIVFNLFTSAATEGNIIFTLRHEPDKKAEGVSQGDIHNAGGETDFTATFPIKIQ